MKSLQSYINEASIDKLYKFIQDLSDKFDLDFEKETYFMDTLILKSFGGIVSEKDMKSFIESTYDVTIDSISIENGKRKSGRYQINFKSGSLSKLLN